MPRGTTLYGTPSEIGTAPDSTGSVSDLNTSVFHDGATTNLFRRVSLDGEESDHTQSTPNSYVVSCKKQTIMSSFNARTLGPLGRLEELAECSQVQNIDNLAM